MIAEGIIVGLLIHVWAERRRRRRLESERSPEEIVAQALERARRASQRLTR